MNDARIKITNIGLFVVVPIVIGIFLFTIIFNAYPYETLRGKIITVECGTGFSQSYLTLELNNSVTVRYKFVTFDMCNSFVNHIGDMVQITISRDETIRSYAFGDGI